MEYAAELVRLEEFVEKLLEKYKLLKSDFHALQETLHGREQECAELKKQVAALSVERQEVGNKVSGLLDRIEQWESEQGGCAEVGEISPASTLSSDEQALLNPDGVTLR